MFAISHAVLRRVALSLLVLALSATGALADGEVNINPEKVAIKGYDSVAYFTEGKPVKGKPEFRTEWRDANWWFSSAENLDRFKGDPEKYSPRYGGFCALAVAMGTKADIDPQAWSIVDGRLYLNLSTTFREQWQQHASENIRKADKNWAKMN